MAKYKNVPVDEETHAMLMELCDAYERKQGAQVKALVKAEYEKLEQNKLLPKGGNKKSEQAKKGE